MRFWLLQHFFKRIRRTPSLTGFQIYVLVSGIIILFLFLYLLGSGIDAYAKPYFPEPTYRSIVIGLAILFSDLLFRYIFSSSSFAEPGHYLVPLDKDSYALQTVLLSFFNLINLAGPLFLLFYLPNTSLAPSLHGQFVFWFIVLMLSNNMLVVALKRARLVAVIYIVVIAGVVFMGSLNSHIVINLFVGQPWLAIIYFTLIGLTSWLVIKNTCSSESYALFKTERFQLPKFGVRIDNPILWQEVLLIIRNKRPRGLILTYFLLIPYFFFMFYRQMENPDTSSFMTTFVVFFLVAGLPIQYGYLGLAWECKHLELLLTKSNFKQMLIAKYRLLTVLNVVAFVIVSSISFWKPSFFPVAVASFLLQQGFGHYLLLYFMKLNTKAIDINRSSFFNYQGISAAQMFLPLIIITIEMACFGIVNWLVDGILVFIIIGAIGITGIVFRNGALDYIYQKWQDQKYTLIHNFRK